MTTALTPSAMSQLSEFINFAIENWSMQTSILMFSFLAFALFLIKEKPVTDTLRWLKKQLVMLVKAGYFWFRNKFSKQAAGKSDSDSPFRRLINSLGAISTTKKSLYDTPTYMALSVGADIPELMKSANSGDPHKLILQSDESTDWFIFNQGTVLNFQQPEKITSELIYHRPERPLDGIVLFVSASLFDKSRDEIEREAEKQLRILWKLQKAFKFVLPVYLVVADCHKVEGFSNFWMRDELRQHQNKILGWSNPHEKHHPYESEWISGGLNQVTNTLRELHNNFIKAPASPADMDLLLFPNRLMKRAPAIDLFCSTLFSRSNYHESFMFRGFYFCGKLNTESRGQLPHSILLEELFSKRIFAEANLAYAPQQKLFSSNQRLRMFQYVAGATLLFASVWLAMDASELHGQSDNLTEKIASLPAAPTIDDASRNIKYVNSVLKHVSGMDASSMHFWSIPSSWFSPFQSRLQNYFANQVFGDIVFPAFECRANHLISEQNARSGEQPYELWVEGLASNFVLQQQLHDLMESTDYGPEKVEQEFGELVKQLFGTPLPESFYEKSSVYFSAISDKEYKPGLRVKKNGDQASLKGVYCFSPKINEQQIWQDVQFMSNQFADNLPGMIAAPSGFFETLLSLPGESVQQGWYSHEINFAKQLEQYLTWAESIEQKWLLNPDTGNQCNQLSLSLDQIADEIYPDGRVFNKAFVKRCHEQTVAQMVKDDTILTSGLYEIGRDDKEILFSPRARSLLTSMRAISGLPFIGASQPTDLDNSVTEFYWSVEKLNAALRMFDEYQAFAKQSYSSMSLPTSNTQKDESYLAQAVALKQLQQAMLSAVSASRITVDPMGNAAQFRPINKREAQIQSYITNFKQAQNALTGLYNAFKTLEFEDSQAWLVEVTEEHAHGLLQKIDSLYQDSYVYTPLAHPNWGAHVYTRAMFGVDGEGQLEDYLQAQSNRISLIAFNYVEPLLVFLKQTESQYADGKYALFSKWNNTLVELHKAQQNKDTATTQLVLETFYKDQLANTNQSNCFEQSKLFAKPQQNDLFAKSQRNIIDAAKALCDSYKSEQIQGEYVALFNAFTKQLANKYPFTRSDAARPVSPAAIKAFIDKYPGKKSGLAKRMDILTWAKRDSEDKADYQKAREFVRQLDESLAFFEALIGASQSPNSPGLEVAVEFDVLPEQAKMVTHIGQWQFSMGHANLSFPSIETQSKPHNLYWLPGNPVELQLSWAESSPFTPTAEKGTTRGNELVFSSNDTWSLLTFLEKHHTQRLDTESLMDESILLGFGAKVTSGNGNQKVEPSTLAALALMRVTLFGFDPETKQQVAVKLPGSFPQNAPLIPELRPKGAPNEPSE